MKRYGSNYHDGRGHKSVGMHIQCVTSPVGLCDKFDDEVDDETRVNQAIPKGKVRRVSTQMVQPSSAEAAVIERALGGL